MSEFAVKVWFDGADGEAFEDVVYVVASGKVEAEFFAENLVNTLVPEGTFFGAEASFMEGI